MTRFPCPAAATATALFRPPSAKRALSKRLNERKLTNERSFCSGPPTRRPGRRAGFVLRQTGTPLENGRLLAGGAAGDCVLRPAQLGNRARAGHGHPAG